MIPLAERVENKVRGARPGRKWRILVVVALAAATGGLLAGIAFATFPISGTGPGSASTGGVTLGSPVSSTCNVGPMAPGESSTGYSPAPSPQTDAPCTFSVTYSGSLPAFIGLYFTVSGTGLYDTTDNGLQFEITDNNGHTYTTTGALNASGASAANPLLVATDAGSSNTVHTITVNYALPRLYNSPPDSQDNHYQHLTTTLKLTVEAVQSQGNGSAGSCTVGQRCSGITAWS